MKTTKLRPTFADLWLLHEQRIHDIAFGAAMIVALLLIHSLLKPVLVSAPVVMHEVQRPVILIQTSTALPMPTPAPTQTPWPTAEPVAIEVPGPTPEPQVIYVQSPPEVVYVEAPAPEPPAATLAPQQLVILDRQQWAEQAQQQGR
jgi:hypothetical protein